VNLTFALVSDIHFGPAATYGGKLRKLTAQAPALLRDFVRRMNHDAKPDLVVNLGDDIEDESPEVDRARYGECLGILRTLDADVRHVAGNHDLVFLSEKDLLEAWGRPELGALHYSFQRGGVHFVVLHTRERKDRDVSVGEAQLRWLEQELEAAKHPVIVLMHHSAADQDLTGNRWFEGHANICLVRERKALRRILEASGKVLAVFNGHLHWNHLDVVGGIPYVTVQSLIENLDDDAPGRAAAAYALVRVTRSRIVIEVRGAETCRYQLERG
jgi:Icc protein